jgi:hypothetical protein
LYFLKFGGRVESLKQREQRKGYMANNAINLDNLMSRIGAVSGDEIRLAVLQDEIEIHKSRLEPHDTGHLHTAISVIEHRIEELT